jgi:uncharacterized protein involved in exopolysaccharide biosynthesis
MNHAVLMNLSPRDLMQLVVRYRLRWIVPTVIVALAVGIFAFVRKPTWEASQALVVRNEAVGSQDIPGKFRHSDELKAILDTVLELSKSRSVLNATLVEVGPPADYDDVAAWPTTQDVDDLIDGVKVTAPKGSEYGKTEIFYLKVKNTDRARAIALAAALCNQIESQYGRLRNDKTNSAMLELSEGAHLAAADVQASVKKLTKMEEAVGGDLSELRHLHQSASAGDSDLRRKTVEMESELRQAKTLLAGRNHLLEALNEALVDKDRLLGLPNGMLESLPALRKMKDGLIDAQVRTASLSGTMSSAHPSVRASLVAEREIASQLNEELVAAIRGVEIDRQLSEHRVASLVEQIGEIRGRLEKLAGMRAEYSAVIVQAEQRSQVLATAEQKLSEARAAHASAEKTSLINRIDTPDTGSKPIGPTRTMLLLGGVFGGLVAGFGLVLLTVPSSMFFAAPAGHIGRADLTVARDLELKGDAVTAALAA